VAGRNKPILPPSTNSRKQYRRLRSACSSLVGNFLGYPPQAIVEALTGDGARGLYVPVVVLYAVEGEGIRDLGWGHRILEILLVCKHEDNHILEVPMLEQPEELVFDDVDASTVRAVNYYNHSMSSSVVCCP
jgi:hypothetical protein